MSSASRTTRASRSGSASSFNVTLVLMLLPRARSRRAAPFCVRAGLSARSQERRRPVWWPFWVSTEAASKGYPDVQVVDRPQRLQPQRVELPLVRVQPGLALVGDDDDLARLRQHIEVPLRPPSARAST